MSLTLPTSNLILRDFTLCDIRLYVEQCQDPKYQRFYNVEDCSIAKSTYLANLFIEQANYYPRTQYHLAIECKYSGEYLGLAALRLEANHQASIGCGLTRYSQGKGVSEEAMQSLIHFGFTELGVKRVYAETISKNKAAIRLCQRVGMKIDTERVNDRFFKNKWWNTTVLTLAINEFG
ncbi:GNAT family N-acetyltransferase [Vibrio sp. VPAP30]|uniref:GNAT family N-acetyltransferase n=1 Tax=Vibrio sp. VPAP30 TaxID=1647102 RepID=UPI00065853C7|nr:GNAT family protein [Vibrio sp. VPAP30]KLN63698.1 acetyltransferase [Vibrio sp. VPAP30]